MIIRGPSDRACVGSAIRVTRGSLPTRQISGSLPEPADNTKSHMSDTEELKLAAEFPAATREQWLALVERVLKGRPVATLTARTADGIAIEPLYARSRDGAPIAAREGRWQVMARVDHPDPA